MLVWVAIMAFYLLREVSQMFRIPCVVSFGPFLLEVDRGRRGAAPSSAGCSLGHLFRHRRWRFGFGREGVLQERICLRKPMWGFLALPKRHAHRHSRPRLVQNRALGANLAADSRPPQIVPSADALREIVQGVGAWLAPLTCGEVIGFYEFSSQVRAHDTDIGWPVLATLVHRLPLQSSVFDHFASGVSWNNLGLRVSSRYRPVVVTRHRFSLTVGASARNFTDGAHGRGWSCSVLWSSRRRFATSAGKGQIGPFIGLAPTWTEFGPKSSAVGPISTKCRPPEAAER